MVRLKVPRKGMHDKRFIISIPYGAIKSLNLEAWQLNLQRISIPYGAIKSEFFRNSQIFSNLISIPYGAIKRICF